MKIKLFFITISGIVLLLALAVMIWPSVAAPFENKIVLIQLMESPISINIALVVEVIQAIKKHILTAWMLIFSLPMPLFIILFILLGSAFIGVTFGHIYSVYKNIRFRRLDKRFNRVVGYFIGSDYVQDNERFSGTLEKITDRKWFGIADLIQQSENYGNRSKFILFLLSLMYIFLVVIGILEIALRIIYGSLKLLIVSVHESGYVQAHKIFSETQKKITDKKWLSIAGLAHNLGNYKDSSRLVLFFLSLIYIPLAVAGILEMTLRIIFGFLWLLLITSIHCVVLFIGMSIFYVFFTLLWIVDYTTLAIQSIQSRCGNCKRFSIIPVFNCPGCGTEHKKLTPDAYGILKRKCTCNEKLPTAFFNGRSKLKASCPFCASELAASDARQFGIQLVGGVSTGKTTFLAAFWHKYIEYLETMHNLTYETFPADAFEELEDWYQKGLSSSTTETNANMYSIVHKLERKTSYQLTVYDIAGEAFTELGNTIQQQQFRYCEGLIFVIDPTVAPSTVSETFSSFINEFKGLKGKHSAKVSDIPTAVIVSKADLFKREIGLLKIKSRKNEFCNTEGKSDSELIRIAGNEICKEFLKNHGFENVLNLIDGEFNNAQYFPVSAMGHTAVLGQPYEPWGIMEPVKWILSYADGSFKDILKHMII